MGSYFWLVDRCRPNERNFLYASARKFIAEFLDSVKPDTVLSVHPMLNHFVQRFIKEEQLGIPCYTFLTDPFPPFWQGWSSPWVDQFFVPTHEALQELTAMGVEAWRIDQVPMPVRSQFRPFTPAARDAFHEELSLEPATTILLNGGARGGGPLLSVYHAARRAAPDANILVVCGRNDALRHRLQTLRHPKTLTFGYVHDIHRFIAASDLVLTKPGALSTYETLACGVPVLLLGLRGLMPQETGLFHAAAHYEFGFVASRLGDVEEIISQGRQTWNRIRSSLAAFYQVSYGEEIVERILHAHVPA
jgi:UDP-N-acetylglucosamine:LPS N-acetylglucosamine transferase